METSLSNFTFPNLIFDKEILTVPAWIRCFAQGPSYRAKGRLKKGRLL